MCDCAEGLECFRLACVLDSLRTFHFGHRRFIYYCIAFDPACGASSIFWGKADLRGHLDESRLIELAQEARDTLSRPRLSVAHGHSSLSTLS